MQDEDIEALGDWLSQGHTATHWKNKDGALVFDSQLCAGMIKAPVSQLLRSHIHAVCNICITYYTKGRIPTEILSKKITII